MGYRIIQNCGGLVAVRRRRAARRLRHGRNMATTADGSYDWDNTRSD